MKKRRAREIQTNTDYSRGERSPYGEWVERQEGFDPQNLEQVADSNNHWPERELSDEYKSKWKSFIGLLPSLKGRQRDVTLCLIRGETSQVVIAKELGMSPQGVNKTILALRKKILQKIG